MSTLSDFLRDLATGFADCPPDVSEGLMDAAAYMDRLECALNEAVADAQEDERLVAAHGRRISLRPPLAVIQGGRA